MLLKKERIDYVLVFVILVLLGIGIIMVFSASQYYAQNEFNDSFYFLKKQGFNALIGVIAMLILSKVNYRLYFKFSLPILLIGIALVAFVLFSEFGDESGGAVRWLDLGFVRFQPSEILKIAVIIFMAKSLYLKKNYLNNFTAGFMPYLLLLCAIGGMVAFQDLGTAIVIVLIMIVMFFCSGVPIRFIALLIPIGALAVAAFVYIEPYRIGRMMSFLHPWDDPKGVGMQVIQSLYAFGSGGLTGMGLGAGGAKWLYLPERHTDFIFPIVGEELGFIGCVVIILLFMLFTWRGVNISWRMEDEYGRLLALGITGMIAIQAIINLFVVTGMMPVTGLTLPFISYGGTSLVISLASMGILLNISKYVRLDRWRNES